MYEYRREPLPEPSRPGRQIRTLLTAAANRPRTPTGLPARPEFRSRTRPDTTRALHRAHEQVGETATR